MVDQKGPPIKRRKRLDRGQAISEYAMLLAFIAVIVSLVFAFAPGKLAPAVSAAFSSITSEINEMNETAAQASSFINILELDYISQ